jgi:hypothetical protein
MPPRDERPRSTPDPGDRVALAEHRAAESRQADAQAQIEEELELPPPAHVRNINYDTHVGYAPQRPYARLEDRMGVAQQYPSFEALAAALPGGPGNEIEQDETGMWVRYVPEHRETGKDESGDVVNVIEDVPRFVALTQEAARAASASGQETDSWSGFTWLRRGYKPEKDLATSGPKREPRLRIEKASPLEAATVEKAEHRQRAQDVVPRLSDDAPKLGATPAPKREG